MTPTPQHSAYLELLRRWNSSINLVSAGDVDRLEERHLADSLALLSLIPDGSLRLTDLGTGAGFPGLPIAIARPELQVTLLDAKTKAIAFVKAVRRELGLTNVEVFHGRVEDYRPAPPPDLVVSRAAFPPPKLLEIAATLLPSDSVGEGGHLIVMLNKDNDAPTHPGFALRDSVPGAEGRSNHLYQRIHA
jgi:16S rRNA (guanine527-N7)-methyltransferase